MNKNEIKTLIRLGFEPARYFKRSAWVKVERVMEFLVKKGVVINNNGDVKYKATTILTEAKIDQWADLFMKSPLQEHLDGMKKLSKEMGLPLNSREVLNKYMDLTTKC